MHRSESWMSHFHVACDSNGVDNQVTRLTSPQNGLMGARTLGYGQNAYYANIPDWLRATEGGQAILTCNANKVRGVFYDGRDYRTYAQGVSFIGMNNALGSNRAEFLRDLIEELAGYQGLLTGHVLNNITGEPIENAIVEVPGCNIRAMTDVNGQFSIPRFPVQEFDLTVTADGFTPLDEVGFDFGGDREMAIELRMRHPELVMDPGIVSVEIEPDQTLEGQFTISNPGDGPLEVSIRPHALRRQIEPWGELDQVEAGALLNDSRLEAAIFFQDHYWIAGGGSGANNPNYMYKLNRDFELVATYDQGSFSNYGWRDLTTDGIHLYGVDSTYIAQFDVETGARTDYSIPVPVNPAWSVAWDDANGVFWVACTGSHIFAVDFNGNVIQTIRNNQRFRIASLAVRPDDPDGKTLYILGEYEDVDGRVVKMNPAENDPTVVFDIPLNTDERTGGAEFCYDFLPSTASLIVQMQRGVQSVRALEAGTNFDWFTVEPTSATIEAGEWAPFNVTLSSAGRAVGDQLTAYLELVTNSNAEEPFVDVGMTVIATPPPNSTENDPLPLAYGIDGAYPNPFNGRSLLSVSLDRSESIRLAIYDLAGREVATLYKGEAPAGKLQLALNADSWPAGLYVARLESAGRSDQFKLTLVK